MYVQEKKYSNFQPNYMLKERFFSRIYGHKKFSRHINSLTHKTHHLNSYADMNRNTGTEAVFSRRILVEIVPDYYSG